MTIAATLDAFASRLGHGFSDPTLLRQALIHGSASTPASGDNQRLEFLGDRVLALVMAEALLDADKAAPEGLLAPRFNALVRKETCAEVARDVDLGAVLQLGRSEMLSGGRRKDALLGDAMEAVIASVYLDGGLEAARAMILRLWGDRISSVEHDARDPKTALQEWVQARKLTTPVYTQVGRTGPDHAPVFTIRVEVGTGDSTQATAGSKRQAEQAAARMLLEILDGRDAP